MLLVKFNRDWADEFSAYGFALMDDLEYLRVLNWSKNCSFYFGTNEGWESEDISDGFTAEAVTDLEIAVLTKLFPELKSDYNPRVGIIPTISSVYDNEYDVFYESLDEEAVDIISRSVEDQLPGVIEAFRAEGKIDQANQIEEYLRWQQ